MTLKVQYILTLLKVASSHLKMLKILKDVVEDMQRFSTSEGIASIVGVESVSCYQSCFKCRKKTAKLHAITLKCESCNMVQTLLHLKSKSSCDVCLPILVKNRQSARQSSLKILSAWFKLWLNHYHYIPLLLKNELLRFWIYQNSV